MSHVEDEALNNKIEDLLSLTGPRLLTPKMELLERKFNAQGRNKLPGKEVTFKNYPDLGIRHMSFTLSGHELEQSPSTIKRLLRGSNFSSMSKLEIGVTIVDSKIGKHFYINIFPTEDSPIKTGVVLSSKHMNTTIVDLSNEHGAIGIEETRAKLRAEEEKLISNNPPLIWLTDGADWVVSMLGGIQRHRRAAPIQEKENKKEVTGELIMRALAINNKLYRIISRDDGEGYTDEVNFYKGNEHTQLSYGLTEDDVASAPMAAKYALGSHHPEDMRIMVSAGDKNKLEISLIDRRNGDLKWGATTYGLGPEASGDYIKTYIAMCRWFSRGVVRRFK